MNPTQFGFEDAVLSKRTSMFEKLREVQQRSAVFMSENSEKDIEQWVQDETQHDDSLPVHPSGTAAEQVQPILSTEEQAQRMLSAEDEAEPVLSAPVQTDVQPISVGNVPESASSVEDVSIVGDPVASVKTDPIQWIYMDETERELFRKSYGHNAMTVVSGSQLLSDSRFAKVSRRIIVSEKLKLIYCPIPKVGNSAFKFLIRKMEGFADYEDLRVAHDHTRNGLKFILSYSPEDLDRILSDPSYFRMVFVRNPFTRELSAFLNKFVQKSVDDSEYALFMNQLFGYSFFRKNNLTVEQFGRLSFDQFVERVSQQNPVEMNEHWAPQVDLCGLDSISYDFVGRFESMALDSQKVLNLLGRGDEQLPSQSKIKFLGSGANEAFKQYYTPHLMNQIASTFGQDFEILHYPLSPPDLQK
uniref:Carbohydrate sulfotransferase n=1 Tax=Timspurckia oligopyrenoides TaxID=708627 RepID=A0A7S1EQZ3_9RHOD